MTPPTDDEDDDGEDDEEELVAFDLRSVSTDGSTARITIPAAGKCITDGGEADDEIIAKVWVSETGAGTVRVTAEIDR